MSLKHARDAKMSATKLKMVLDLVLTDVLHVKITSLDLINIKCLYPIKAKIHNYSKPSI